MSCKLYFGALLSVALLAEPLIAQTGATVEHVLVRGNADAMEVEIQTSGAIAPNTQAITGPDRIVVDFPGALPSAELRSLTVNRGALKSVRSGLFFKDPPITRIVLDLDKAQPYRISSTQNAVVVKLGASAAQKQVASAPSSAGAQLRETALVTTPSGSPARLAMSNATSNVTIPGNGLSRASGAAPATIAMPLTPGANVPSIHAPAVNPAALGQGIGDAPVCGDGTAEAAG